MIHPPDTLSQDTPIRRACIRDMTTQQIEQHVDLFRERRMRAHTAYMEAKKIKEEAKHQKDAALMQRRLDQLEKVFKSLDSNLEKAFKYANEIKVLSIIG